MTIRVKQLGATFVYESGPLPNVPIAIGGSNGCIQFNDNGLFGGNTNFSFNSSSSTAYLSGSFSQGIGTKASGIGSHAQGSATRATGIYSHAEGRRLNGGYSAEASGDYSHTEGEDTTSSGVGSHAEGYGTIASGDYSHAEGRRTSTVKVGASGDYSHAEGYDTEAPGDYSHAEGMETQASGSYSHAEGQSTYALRAGSHAEGYYTVTRGGYSHAEGQYTIAIGNWSHAEGMEGKSGGDYSHVEGEQCESPGYASHAQGGRTISSGSYSFTAGQSTIASGSYQAVFGQFNKRDNIDSLFIVGNGTADDDANRSDVFRIDPAGRVEVTGSLSVSDSMELFADRLEVTGTISVTGGISGSLTALSDGTPYLIAGSGITLTTGSTGTVTISSINGGALTTVDLTPNSLLWALDESSGPYIESGLSAPGPSFNVTGSAISRLAPRGHGIYLATNSDYVATEDTTAGRFPDFTWHWWRRGNDVGNNTWGPSMPWPSVGGIVYTQMSDNVGGTFGLVASITGIGSTWISHSIPDPDSLMATAMRDDKWHHYSLRFSSTGDKIFRITVDGTLLWESSAQSNGIDYVSPPAAPIWVLGKGTFSRVTMEPTVLTTEELRTIWAKGIVFWP